MCLFFFLLQTIPARSTIPLYSRLIEAYIVQAFAGVLRFVRVEPRALAIRLPLPLRDGLAKVRRAAWACISALPIKGILPRAAGQRYGRGSGVGRTPQSPQDNSYHLRQPAAPRLADKKGRTAGRA